MNHEGMDHPGHAMPMADASSASPVDWSSQSDPMIRQNASSRDLDPRGPVAETLTVDGLKAQPRIVDIFYFNQSVARRVIHAHLRF